jgi:nucleoside-diphosphate-sugar epimerase
MTASSKTVLIVGGLGFLGRELAHFLQGTGWRIICTSRNPRESGQILYALGGDFPQGALAGVDAIVHCAYDFGPTSWPDIHQKNVVGTQRLLDQATQAGIKTFITVSSISAFPQCHSLYGKAKLLIEAATLAAGGMVLRPGLIYGGSNRGMFGRLSASVKRARPVPLLVGSSCTQFLVHVDDLNRIIELLLSNEIPRPASVWTVAHSKPWPLRHLLLAMAGNRKVHFIPVPWQAVWLALRAVESLGIRMAFKSDSVRSIVYQNPAPDLSQVAAAGIKLREYHSDTN